MTEARYSAPHKAAADALLLALPGVVAGKAFGYPAYKVNGKVFAFVGGNAISFKCGQARAAELKKQYPTLRAFEPAQGLVWNAWLTIDVADPQQLWDYEALLAESAAFVAQQ